jgi:hypothetical protein
MTAPPYPRLGECVRAMCLALDTKGSNRDVDRLAREGDFDWTKVDALINELLVEGARRLLGPLADEVLMPWLRHVRTEYCRLVLDVPLDAIGRAQALPTLVEEFFVPRASQLLLLLRARCPGPRLGVLLEDERSPVRAVLEWLDQSVGSPVDKLLYQETTGSDKVSRDKMVKWRTGIDLPSGQSLKLLVDDLRREPGTRGLVDVAGAWLLIARALSQFDRLGAAPARPLLRAYLESAQLDWIPRKRLQELVATAGAAWPEMADLGRRLWHDLQRTARKQAGDQADTWRRIQALEMLTKEHDLEGRTAYHVAWMKGRWHTLSGQYEDAQLHYEQAFELACYRAGRQVKDIVEDAICVAAFLDAKVFVRQLKQVGIVLGLFERPAEDAAVVEAWELEQFAQQLPLRFPPHGRFVESEPDLSDAPTPGLMTIALSEMEAIKPDLRKPDRVRAVRYGNGLVRRCPQLRLFASFGRFETVRALLEAGASVDTLDSSGASALLCAMQYAHDRGDRAVLDLLLATEHQASTLNAATNRKRLTPMMCAIDLGEPDVVLKLLEMGADSDRLALTDLQSPLHYTITKISGRVHPHRMLEGLLAAILSEPDDSARDALRRFGVASAGVFGDNMTRMRNNQTLARETAKALVDLHVRRYSVEKLMQIVAMLLRFGADPNRGHGYPVPGRTPLMLAAETDNPGLFELLVERGGDPLKPDAQGQSSFQIAMAFQSHRVLARLQQSAR